MRGLKFGVYIILKCMVVSHRLRTMRGLKFLRLFLSSHSNYVASFAYDAWIEIDLAVQQGYALIVASFAYDAWIEILKESSWVLFSVCRIVCVRCVD